LETIVSTGVIGISIGAQYALISIGFTLIFGIMGVVNFAHGAFYIIGGYFAYTLTSLLGAPFIFAVVLATFLTALVGYFVEIIVV